MTETEPVNTATYLFLSFCNAFVHEPNTFKGKAVKYDIKTFFYRLNNNLPKPHPPPSKTGKSFLVKVIIGVVAIVVIGAAVGTTLVLFLSKDSGDSGKNIID